MSRPETDAYEPELAQLIEETDWVSVTKRLLVYARMRMRHGASVSQNGKHAEDYVCQAVMLLLEGRRPFRSDTPTLLAFLCRIIDSFISHEREREIRLRLRPSVAPKIDDAFPKYVRKKETWEQEIDRQELDSFLTTLEPGLEKYMLRIAEDKQLNVDQRLKVEDVRNHDSRRRNLEVN